MLIAAVVVPQLRDEVGIRDDLSNKLLALKRAELAGVLSGNKQPPPLGAMLFRWAETPLQMHALFAAHAQSPSLNCLHEPAWI